MAKLRALLHKKFFWVLIAIIAIAIVWLLSHKSSEKKSQATAEKTVVVEKKPIVETLAYFGTIQPLSVTSVSTPVPGAVTQVDFHYGEQIQEGDLLLVINSEKLQQDYRDALTNYLKSKDTYYQSKSSFEGTKLLYDNGIIAKEQFTSALSQLESNELALITASNQLQKTSKQLPDIEIDAETLTLGDIDKIKNILSQEYSELRIYANADGIILFPTSDSGGDGDNGGSAKTLTVGSEVKQGQVLVNIGDLSGLTTTIAVNELDVNRIKTGQNVIVTSPALPQTQLKGLVASVASQAKVQSSGQATFPTIIVVPKIPAAARKLIRIGMEAKVELNFESAPQLQIPIDAVQQKGGENYVVIIDPKTNARKEIIVETGTTNQDNVVIMSGIEEGQKVILRD